MPTIQRFFIEIAYRGTAYHGWQTQPNALTVQEVLDDKLSIVFRQKVETLGCGRTDAGVHATQFFAHFDLEEVTAEDILRPIIIRSLNAILPLDIIAKRIIKVEPTAHARFDATLRAYEYHIHFSKDPFKTDNSWLLKEDILDIKAMNQAAALVSTFNDFTSFCKANADNNTHTCKIYRCKWEVTDNGIVFHIAADRFLRNMVRAIVGTLVDVGRGKLNPEDLKTIIESKNRSNAGASVPACGLYLTKVEYNYISNGR